MKSVLTTILCVALTLALVTGAVGIGAVRGWNTERNDALQALTSNEELAASLQERAMDAANLAVVTARHLPETDDDLSALRSACAVLTDPASATPDLIHASADISEAAASLATRLPELESVKASQRDQVYIRTLTRVLSEEDDLTAHYMQSVAGFNHRLTTTLTGQLAMLLGVQPIEIR